MLERDPRHRLGGGRDGAAAVRQHKWFAECGSGGSSEDGIIDWGAMARREVTAPWAPSLRAPDDASNFATCVQLHVLLALGLLLRTVLLRTVLLLLRTVLRIHIRLFFPAPLPLLLHYFSPKSMSDTSGDH